MEPLFCILNRVGVASASRFAIPRQGREAGDATALFLASDFFAEQRANGVGSGANAVGPWANMEAALVARPRRRMLGKKGVARPPEGPPLFRRKRG